MSNIIGAIKIVLDQRYIERSEIGLYTPETGNSEIRWSEVELIDAIIFSPLGQTVRRWFGIAAASNGDIYACVMNGGIYKQTGGAGNFISLGQTSRFWACITAAPNGDVYAGVSWGDIYKQTGGTGNFIALGQTSRTWHGIAAAPNGDIYACVSNGDIYKQTGGTGNFIALGQTVRYWTGITVSANGDIYACENETEEYFDIYKQTGGTGNFIATGQSPAFWQGMASHSNGYIYAIASDIYYYNGISIDPYNHEMLLRNGIGEISSSFDDSIGGNNSTVNNFTFSIKGTNQFFLKISELKIQLSGKTVEYIEFEGTDADSDSISTTTMFKGTIEDYSWNEFGCDIIVKSSFLIKRNKCLGQRVTTSNYPDADEDMLDKTIPITFGRSDPANGRYFKLPRVEYKNDLITNNEILGGYDEPKYMSNFPAAELSGVELPANKIRFLLTDDGTENGSDAKNSYIIAGKYIHITDADTSQDDCVGTIRKIQAKLNEPFFNWPSTQLAMAVQLVEYMSEHIISYIVNNPAGFKAFLSIIDALTEYILDNENCECFIGNQEIYIKEDDEMIRAVDVGIVQNDADVPMYEIAADVYDGEIGNTNSYKILPVESLEPYLSETGDLSQFEHSDYDHPLDGSSDPVAGVFVQSGSGTLCANQGIITGVGNYKDRSYTTQYLFNSYLSLEYPVDHYDYIIAFKITLPKIDESIQFDNIYFGLRCTSSTIDASSEPDKLTFSGHFKIMYKSYYDKIIKPVDKTEIEYEDIVEIESLPDDYYSNSPSSDNKEFYYNEETATRLTGYKTFNLNIMDMKTYNNIHEFTVQLWRHANQIGRSSYVDDYVAIFEAAIIFEKNITIGKELYA
jgi:uncharacterized Zn-binding protein involved in type VI secretion